MPAIAHTSRWRPGRWAAHCSESQKGTFPPPKVIKNQFLDTLIFLFQVIFFPGLGAVVVTFFPGLAAGPGTLVGVPLVRRNSLWLINRKEYYNQTFTF